MGRVPIRITFEADTLDELVAELAQAGELFHRGADVGSRVAAAPVDRPEGSVRKTEAATSAAAGGASDVLDAVRAATRSGRGQTGTGSVRRKGGGRTSGVQPNIAAADRRQILERKATDLWRDSNSGRRDLIIAIVELQLAGLDTTSWEVADHMRVSDRSSVSARMARLRRVTDRLDEAADEPRILDASGVYGGRLR